jgi:hypothetical protein
MTNHCPRMLTAMALAATGLLLAACSSSPSQPSTQATASMQPEPPA